MWRETDESWPRELATIASRVGEFAMFQPGLGQYANGSIGKSTSMSFSRHVAAMAGLPHDS